MQVQRLTDGPIIRPDMDDRMGSNINGPSLIRVPKWVRAPLGKYYLYFAHHQGKYLRMAYADKITGPYTIYSPGVLDIANTPYTHHIASPDVRVDEENELITMLYHGSGAAEPNNANRGQTTTYAQSEDGLLFVSDRRYLAESYLRTFSWRGWHYGFSGGPHRILSRTRDLREPPERGIVLQIAGEHFTNLSVPDAGNIDASSISRIRHICFHRKGSRLAVYYSNVGDAPERIKRTIVDVSGNWATWRGSRFEEVLRPETDYEGAGEPVERSSGGSSHIVVNQLRDPYVFEERGRAYLLYTVAGEHGIGIAELPKM